ncbi:MAG: hypothetical protein AMS21_00880 [Gemmatimonas sp. SG8_38_2]|nr:MAG: hypothetical protein AMS21_00880 [Gemmatimonas sp. SG8_38_2]
MSVDFQKYTYREAGKELATIEQHLRAFGPNSRDFCLECIAKHTMHLSKLASEGKGFFPNDVDWWTKLEDWTDKILDEGEAGEVNHEKTQAWAEEARLLRKELQSKYMGNMGRCECVTGLEPCCHGG